MSQFTARRGPGQLGRVILRDIFSTARGTRTMLPAAPALRLDGPQRRLAGTLLRRSRQVK